MTIEKATDHAPRVPSQRIVVYGKISTRCVVCRHPISEDDLVSVPDDISNNDTVDGRDIAHARCVVIVVEPDGSKTGTRHPLNIEMSRAEWSAATG